MGAELSSFKRHNKNYLLFPTTLDNESDYLKFIQAMKDYSERCYFFEPISKSDVPFPMVFILNLMSRFPQYLVFDDKDDTKHSKFMQYLPKYIEQYFLRNYKPNEIPLLYSIIMDYLSKTFYTNGFKQEHNYKIMKHESMRYHELAVQYLFRHFNSINISYLSKTFVKRLETSGFSIMPMHLLNRLVTFSNDNAMMLKKRHYVKNSIALMNESFKRFVVKHKNYSIYHRECDDFCKAGFVFVCEMTKRMIQNDMPKRKLLKYQKRYKYLLKIALKTWKKYIGTDLERFGLYNVYLGYYYAIFCKKKNNLEIARKLLYKGVEIIRNYFKYTKTLCDVYIFLVWIEKSLCNFDECIHVIQMSIEFNYYYNLTEEMNEDKHDLIELKTMQKWNEVQRERHRKVYWKQYLHVRKKSISQSAIYSESLSSWIYYFEHDKWYQVMKNICKMKECNYSKCRSKSIKLLKCSKCKSVYYCCKKHQKLDWMIQHGAQCQKFNGRQ
eukprot:281742_1